MPLQFRGTHSKSSKPKGSSLWYSLRLLNMNMNKVARMGQSLNWRDNCYQLLKAPMVSFADAWGTLTMKSLKSANALTTTPKRWNRFNRVSAPHLLQAMKSFKSSSERCQINWTVRIASWTIRIARLLNSKQAKSINWKNSKLASNSCSHQLWWQWKNC